VQIPSASIASCEFAKDVTRHLGVLRRDCVGLVKMRRHHYFSISYRIETGETAQIVVFAVPKDMPRTLEAIPQNRAPGACNPVIPPSIHIFCLSHASSAGHSRNCPKRAS
jgi:hypothetical protein